MTRWGYGTYYAQNQPCAAYLTPPLPVVSAGALS
ncbi:MAG: hypothetical protein QOF09_781 [Alphaproteobacteria bacterium]|nr:hypothetical protein [Alphaproteobacteria bacterium]